MKYEWAHRGRVWEFQGREGAYPKGWEEYLPIGRLRKVKNKRSCKKFVVERFNFGSWEYITLLVMKLDEAKLVAQTLLCAGANDD